MANRACREELGETVLTDAGIVGDHGEFAQAAAGEMGEQRVRSPCVPESADKDRRPALDPVERRVQSRDDLVNHRVPC